MLQLEMMRRSSRRVYLAAAITTVAIGLTLHWQGGRIPSTARDIIGDALWASLLFWLTGLLAPRLALRWRATVALVISFLVELSQLYHAPNIDAIRATAVGHLVLGTDFDVRDLGAYTIGVLAALLSEHGVKNDRRPSLRG